MNPRMTLSLPLLLLVLGCSSRTAEPKTPARASADAGGAGSVVVETFWTGPAPAPTRHEHPPGVAKVCGQSSESPLFQVAEGRVEGVVVSWEAPPGPRAA